MIRALTILFICGFSCFGIAQNKQIFEEANALYNQEKFAEAIDKYQSIVDANLQSPELYYNLGNAHYKLNHVAPSIYYYEKALQLSPNDKDIENNLAFARNMTIDAIDKVPEVGFSRLINSIVNLLHRDTWAKIAIGAVILFVLLFLTFHFSYSTAKKRIAFVSSLVSLLMVFFAITMAFKKDQLNRKNNPAIVFVQESRVQIEPNKSSEELFRLHEGTKVQVLDSDDGWHKIELSDKSVGWMSKEDIKLLNDI